MFAVVGELSHGFSCPKEAINVFEHAKHEPPVNKLMNQDPKVCSSISFVANPNNTTRTVKTANTELLKGNGQSNPLSPSKWPPKNSACVSLRPDLSKTPNQADVVVGRSR